LSVLAQVPNKTEAEGPKRDMPLSLVPPTKQFQKSSFNFL
jgi:hypothetical protein